MHVYRLPEYNRNLRSAAKSVATSASVQRCFTDAQKTFLYKTAFLKLKFLHKGLTFGDLGVNFGHNGEDLW